jgi:hypothetical protein
MDSISFAPRARNRGSVHSASNWSLSQVGDGVGIVYVHELR